MSKNVHTKEKDTPTNSEWKEMYTVIADAICKFQIKEYISKNLNGISSMAQFLTACDFRFHAWALQRDLLKEGRGGLAR